MLTNIKARWFLVGWAMLVGCASSAPPRHDATPLRLARDTTSTCPPEGSDRRCALASPYQDWARETPKSTRHLVNLLDIGDDALLLRVHLIRSARHTIEIQQFIWSFDASGRFLFRELVHAARRGVSVRILGDHLATISDAVEMSAALLAHQNLEIRVYNPSVARIEASSAELAWSAITRFSKLNQRMHNKLLVIDRRMGVVGGRNHEDRYFDRDAEYVSLDRDLLIAGPAVREMGDSFQEYWQSELAVPAELLSDVRERIVSGRAEPFDADRPIHPSLAGTHRDASSYEAIRARFFDNAVPTTGRVAFFADPPGKKARRLPWKPKIPSVSSGILDVVREVEERLILETPYLVLSREAGRALKRLRKRRPGIRIIASTNSLAATDHWSVYAMTFKQKRKLLEKFDFRIFELMPKPGEVHSLIPRFSELAGPENEGPVVGLHGKSIVVDDRIALVGSHNFDPRSVDYDTQVAVAIWDVRIASALGARIMRNTETPNSWVVAKQLDVPFFARAEGALARFSRALPIGDFWPFRYSACFRLRSGKTPLDTKHPDFYAHYKNVGQFPTLETSVKAIHTRIFSAMGGFATPLL